MVTLFIVLTITIIALYTRFIVRRRKIGSKAAGMELLRYVVVFIILFALLNSVFPGSLQDRIGSGIFLILAAVILVQFIFLPSKKKEAGSLLLNIELRQNNYKLSAISGVLLVFMSSYILMQSISKDTHNIPEISRFVLFIFCGILIFYIGLSKVEIRERGILFFPCLYRWEEIASYQTEWEKGITLWFKKRLIFPGYKRFLVSPDQKETVDQLLSKYIHKKNDMGDQNININLN